MAIFTPKQSKHWYPDKSDLVRWYYELAEYLKNNPILGKDDIVTSVNGEKGDVTIPCVENVATVTYEAVPDQKMTFTYHDAGPEFDSKTVRYQGEALNWEAYTDKNPPPYPVTSVNGMTGDVTISGGDGPSDAYTPSNPPPYPVTSVNGQTGDVTVETTDPQVIEQLQSDVEGIENQAAQLTTAVGAINDSLPTKYSAINPPPYPVTSVNGQTGEVQIETGPADAYTPSNPPPYPVKSIYGLTGEIGFAANSVKYSINDETVNVAVPPSTAIFFNLEEMGELPAGNTVYVVMHCSSDANTYRYALIPLPSDALLIGFYGVTAETITFGITNASNRAVSLSDNNYKIGFYNIAGYFTISALWNY